MINRYNYSTNTLRDDIIKSAVIGDILALESILKSYDLYINHLATESYCNEYGEQYSITDQTICDELKNHLIECILKFKIAN